MPDLPEEQQQQVVVTTDNAANIKGAVQQSSMHHIRCFAHCINLSIQKFVSELDSHLARVRSIVRYFHNSSSATNLLKVGSCISCICFRARLSSIEFSSNYSVTQ